MNKRILIATNSLVSGGVEVSLIRFLKELSNYKNFDITLLLLKKEGIYLNDIPKGIKILEVKYDTPIYNYNNKKEDIKNFKNILEKIKFICLRTKLRILQSKDAWEKYYKLILKYTVIVDGDYDLAIDWHGYGHFISSVVASKVNAKKKVMWIHDEKNEWLSKVECWLNSYDKFFCVAKSCIETLLTHHPNLKNKTEVFYNLIDNENIIKKANEKININFEKNKLNIVTVGRLEWQKGYDISIEIAEQLKKKNINFCWYIIGGGSLENQLKKIIKDKELDKNVIILGLKKNPYPFIKKADLYVQTSRHEGYGLAIAEARLLGTVPIATDLKCIREQIIDGKTGFLCKLDIKEFTNKIIELKENKELRDKVVKNLTKENFDFTSEFEKVFNLLK